MKSHKIKIVIEAEYVGVEEEEAQRLGYEAAKYLYDEGILTSDSNAEIRTCLINAGVEHPINTISCFWGLPGRQS